jgi:hypothetical protein
MLVAYDLWNLLLSIVGILVAEDKPDVDQFLCQGLSEAG